MPPPDRPCPTCGQRTLEWIGRANEVFCRSCGSKGEIMAEPAIRVGALGHGKPWGEIASETSASPCEGLEDARRMLTILPIDLGSED